MATSGIGFPPSNATVRVQMIDTTAVLTVRAESFVKPVQEGHNLLNLTDVAFLIEHEGSGKRVMFDLGVRKDYWNLAAVLQKRLGSVIPSLRVEKDVPEILTEGGIGLDTICESTEVAACIALYVSHSDLSAFQLQSFGRIIIGIISATCPCSHPQQRW